MNENCDTKHPMPEPLFYDIRQTASALNCSTKTVRRFLQRGLLSSSNASRKKLIPRKQVEEFVKKTCDSTSFAE
jgi:excisionase family DNA binding protein